MSGQLISMLVAFGLLCSTAVALTITHSEDRAYRTKADFDWTFAQFATGSAFDSDSIASDREKIRMLGLKRMNFGQFRE